MNSSSLPSNLHPLTSLRPLWPAYACESLTSVGTSLFAVAIFFYTTRYFGWTLRQNLLLSAAQGAVYVVGSLAAARVSARHGQRSGLVAIYAFMTGCALLALFGRTTPAIVATALTIHTFAAAISWPLVESLAIAGADAHGMSRRVGVYNLVWSTTNSIVFALSGSIIQHWQVGMFLIPVITHAAGALIMLANPSTQPLVGLADPNAYQAPHLNPEPQLLHQRTLALWLSRIALPATYVVIYTLAAVMPALPVLRSLSPTQATLIASIWMIARVFTFIVFGATLWWHTRPMLLLLSTIIMLFAFIGITMRPSDLPLAGLSRAMSSGFANQHALAAMIASQIVLGIVLGLIYSASLYFGMVLSDASTEHAGYHEALIGLGSVAGPGIAALAQTFYPGDLRAGVAAVSTIVALTILGAGVAALRAVKRNPENPIDY